MNATLSLGLMVGLGCPKCGSPLLIGEWDDDDDIEQASCAADCAGCDFRGALSLSLKDESGWR